MKLKPLYLCLISLAIILLLVCFVVVTSHNKEEPPPVTYKFNSNTGDLTFFIDKNYTLQSLSLQEGILSLPSYDQSSREISFRLNELPPGKRDAIRMTGNAINAMDGFNLLFDVTRSSAKEEILIIQYYDPVTFEEAIFSFPSSPRSASSF